MTKYKFPKKNNQYPKQLRVAPKKKFYIILILGMLTAIGPFSIDMYLPAFPDIAKGLNSNIAHVMLSLSSFFIGISVGQLLYGPLLERFGRKKPMYVGLLIYSLASLGCALSATVNALIAFRLVQALGGCAGMVAARAIVRDVFDVRENAKIFSTLMLVVAVSPIIAPTLGGYVTAVLGWRYVFVILMALSLVILVGIHFFLAESKKPDPNFSLRPGPIISNFLGVIKQPQFYTYALTGAMSYAGLSAYISGSPHVFMEIYHVSEKQYGWIFAIVAMGLITASQINNLLLRTYTSPQIIRGAILCQIAIGVLMVGTELLGARDVFVTIFFIFLFLSCQGFIFPNASALSLAEFGHNAGSASALMGAIQMCIGAGASALVSVLQGNSALPMTGVMACGPILAFAIYWWGRKMIVHRASVIEIQEEDVEMISTL